MPLIAPPTESPERPEPRWRLLVLAGIGGASVGLVLLLWDGIIDGSGPYPEGFAHAAYAVAALVAAAVFWALLREQGRWYMRGLERQRQRHASEEAALSSLLENVAAYSPFGFILLDRQYRVAYANRTALQLHAGELAVGQRCYRALVSRDQHCADCPARTAWSTGRPQVRDGCWTDSRTGEVVRETAVPVTSADGSGRMLIVEEVLTEKQSLRAAIVHQEKMAAFGLLAAGIAHDLGNPLSAIDMHLQLIDADTPAEQTAESLDTVRREVARLRRTLRDLVDFARRRSTEPGLVSLQQVATDALRLLRYDRRMRHVEAVLDADPNAPPVHASEDHLMQVLLNLMVNALDAMPNGGELRLEVRRLEERVVVRVHDTGTGMRREVLARCFEPLFTTKPAGSGTGLGLSVSKQLVEQHRGRLELHSQLGQGTTAVVTLPAAEPASMLGAGAGAPL